MHNGAYAHSHTRTHVLSRAHVCTQSSSLTPQTTCKQSYVVGSLLESETLKVRESEKQVEEAGCKVARLESEIAEQRLLVGELEKRYMECLCARQYVCMRVRMHVHTCSTCLERDMRTNSQHARKQVQGRRKARPAGS